MSDALEAAERVKTIAGRHFFEGLEMLAMIELLKASNTEAVVKGFKGTDKPGQILLQIRKVYLRYLPIQISRCFANPRPIDRTLAQAFKLLKNKDVKRAATGISGQEDIEFAISEFWRLKADDRVARIKTIRDKHVAHLTDAPMTKVRILEIFAVATELSLVMSKLSNATEAVALSIDSQVPYFTERSKQFLSPWEKK